MSVVSVFPGFEVTSYEPEEMITVDQVKARLKISAADTSLDDQIESLIIRSRQYVERFTKCILHSKRTIVQYWDEWPADRVFKLAFFPLNQEGSSPSIGYFDQNGAQQSGLNIQVDKVSFPHRILIPDSVTLPTLRQGINNVFISATYGSDDGSDAIGPLVECMYMLIAAWLENPSDQDQADLNYIHSILNQYTVR